METEQYFKEVEKETRKVYALAEKARALGWDPKPKVEIPLARSLAEKVVGLIATIYPQINDSGIVERILDLEKQYGKLDTMVAFKIAEEIAKQKYCEFSSLLEAIEAGIRVGFAYITLGVVSSPIEGFTKLKTAKTKNGEDYFVAYFSGPVRSAGTTAGCMALILVDYLRELFGYAKYDPSEDEVQRYYIESLDYHERVTNLQYMPTEEEALFLAKHLPIQIAGEPTERKEVSNFKNLERVETDYIRGGMCLIFSEGLAQKAAKGFRLLNKMKEKGLKSSGFDFLQEYLKVHEKREIGKADESPTYIKDLVAGRPVFGHPGRSGGFRFRYGRGRVSGFSAFSLHPATMAITDSFIATGTQLKVEKPTKGGVTTVCDRIDGPIVKLFNGSVKKLSDEKEARSIYTDVEEIIYLGDILFPLSDVINRNAKLIKPGYVEEWWELELKEKDPSTVINSYNVHFDEAVELSKKYGISLHPEYIFYWTQISNDQFGGLIDWLKKSKIDKKIILPYTKQDQERFSNGKRALELLGVEHQVTIENVVINLKNSLALFSNLGIDTRLLEDGGNLSEWNLDFRPDMPILDAVNKVSSFNIKDKAGEFIGTRMGRPEKAKLRKLKGSPNGLFVVGKEGGRLRSIKEACNAGAVSGDLPVFRCESCNRETIYPLCENCGQKTKQMFYCRECGEVLDEKCKRHEFSSESYYRKIDINHFFDKAKSRMGLRDVEVPDLIKGIRGTTSENHVVENLSKGILRAAFDLQVNKDGTIRFDATELPIVAFKPREISADIEKLKNLGYDKDIFGKELTSEEQIVELMPHDVILPNPSDVPLARADKIFIDIANFTDELLERFYNLPRFYNVKKKEDLIGQLGVCMAPHNCAGVICRILGFSNALGLFASPYMHAAIRRDCDGDEAAVMLLGDVLLNFSREFLPGHRGGTQDAPLVLNAKIDAGEVDDQILDFELVGIEGNYPLELYKLAEAGEHSSKIKIKDVREALRLGKNPFKGIGFTHDTKDFNEGVVCSNYKLLGTMQEKVEHQMALVEKIRAVDTSETARLVIERHFLRDLRGNLRKFAMQEFRCVSCNEIMRRPPLSGVCPRCKGKIIFTTHEGGIKKYLEPALGLASKYNLSQYIVQSLELTKRHIDSVFGKEPEQQEALSKWF